MTLVSSDLLAALLTNFQAIFKDSFDAADIAADWRKLCTEFPSNSNKESYNWLGTVPKMREWLDKRAAYGLLGYDFSITNKNFEATIDVDRNTIEDDKLGMIKPRVQQLADEAARYPDELVMLLLNDGATGSIGKAYDGDTYFHADRTIGDSGIINNIVTSGAYAADGDKIRAGIAAAVKLMRLFADDRGRVMNLAPDTLVCAPAMEIAIRSALLPAVAGTVRPETAWVKNIIVHPLLTSGATAGHDYYLLCTSKPIRPIFFQNRKNPEFVALDKPDSPELFMARKVYYGVDMRCNVGWGDPRYGVMVDCSD